MSMFKEGAVLKRSFDIKNAERTINESVFFESVSESAMLESINRIAAIDTRKLAASACIQWADGGDTSFNELDNLLYGMSGADQDGIEHISESQFLMLESLVNAASEFLMLAGINIDDLELAGEDEESSCQMFESLNDYLSDKDSDEVIAEFAVRESIMLESTKKVVRDGEIVLIKTNKRKRKMTAAQRAALKKARSKANNSAAKAARKKALRLRKSANL